MNLRQLKTVPMHRNDWEVLSGPDLRLRNINDPPLLERKAALGVVAAVFSRLQTIRVGFWVACRLDEVLFAECDPGCRVGHGFVRFTPCGAARRGRSDRRSAALRPEPLAGAAHGRFSARSSGRGVALEALAAVAKLSPLHFARMFRAETGTTPSDWRRERRA